MESALELVREKSGRFLQFMNDRINDPVQQRRLVLIIVCIALLLDNMLYMVIVPIIPLYLDKYFDNDDEIGRSSIKNDSVLYNYTDSYNVTLANITTTTLPTTTKKPLAYAEGGGAIGVLFASKAIVQFFINPFTGALIDRIGYDRPLMIGLSVMFFSTIAFAFGESYAVLFVARSLQGVGSAFADTSGLAMIADRFRDDSERTKALGIAQAFISFGCLVAPPFGGVLFEFAGKVVPFIFLSCLCLIDGILLLFVMKPMRKEREISQEDGLKGTPIYRLLIDPYIAVAAGALAMSNVSLAFLEPTIALWMQGTMDAAEWEIGFVWLPAFLPYIGGVYLTVKLAKNYPKYQWLISCVGLVVEGTCCLFIPFCKQFFVVLFPIMGLCLGVALVDTAILPTLGYLVDLRYVSIYGSVYAIADISYSVAYALGPVMAGQIVQSIGFLWLNVAIFLSNVLYAPMLLCLRTIYLYKPVEDERDVLIDDPPSKHYNTYIQNGGLSNGNLKEVGNVDGQNHLKWETFEDNGKPSVKATRAEMDSYEPKDNDASFSFYYKR
jgi:DHA1 family vesicular acetylcholine transporter-like MFS transporter 3